MSSVASPRYRFSDLVGGVRATFMSGKTRNLEWRKQQLRAIIRLLQERRDDYGAALKTDLGATDFLVEVELSGSIKEAENALANLDDWVKSEKAPIPVVVNGSGELVREPYGVVLIIAPWNYPISLAYKPMVGAIAAGNAVVFKPSEVSSECEAVFRRTIADYLDPEAIQVVCGGAEETTELLREKFDYILYTGGGFVGRSVMRQAAEHLTPVTLELGGKSPCIIDSQVNLDVAIRRITWGKFLNCGQTCVAPDYLLVPAEMHDNIVNRLKAAVQQFYGADPQRSPDYSRIINQRHTQRLQRLLSPLDSSSSASSSSSSSSSPSHTVEIGGQVDVTDRYVAPTILTHVTGDHPVMQDEIFGPILPILTYTSLSEAVEYINKRPKPLALYVYSTNRANQQYIIRSTSSGGVAINDSVMHVACPDLPFGGVGESGMGAYNGKYTFLLFSHIRSVLHAATWLDPDIRYPPYTPSKIKTLLFLNRLKLPKPRVISVVLALFLVFVFLYYFGFF